MSEMKMKAKTVLAAFLASLSIFAPAAKPLGACTFVAMAKNGVVLAGYNEDFNDLRTKVWFFRATDKAYGRMMWGADRALYPYQGGMNDQGLFVDFNAVDTGWRPDPRKPNLEETYDAIEHILMHAATVDDAVALFGEYNIDLSQGSYVLADAGGESAIIEWAKDKLQVVERKGDHQIATNFIQSDYDDPKDANDDRYRIADRILRDAAGPSVDVIRRVLSAVHFEAIGSTTLYSTICDLVNKKVHVYHFHNYEEAAVFDLERELEKGDTGHSIPGLFPVRPYSEVLFRSGFRQLGAEELARVIDEKGVRDLARELDALKGKKRLFDRFQFPEWILKSLGLEYLSKGKVEEAVEVFKLNVREYPGSAEALADLGDAYRKQGDVPRAVESYRKALEKNPGDIRAKKALAVLEKDQGCTSFCLDNGGYAVFGANYDHVNSGSDGLVFVNKRNVIKSFRHTDSPGQHAGWTSKYGSVSFNFVASQTSWTGMNEAGLIIYSMRLEEGSRAPGPDGRPWILAHYWPQYMLDNFATVEEVLAGQAALRIVNADRIPHYLVSDRRGNCATVEFIGGKTVIRSGKDLPVRALANTAYERAVREWEEVLELRRNGKPVPGMGSSSRGRFIRAADRVAAFRPMETEAAVGAAFDILKEAGGRANWSIVYDAKGLRVHFKTIVQAEVRTIDFGRLDFSCRTPVKMIDVNEKLSGDITDRLKDHSFELHFGHAVRAARNYGLDMTPEELETHIRLIEAFPCGEPTKER
jgi:penicillin V acylase-like amidase (Ntn superfamily)